MGESQINTMFNYITRQEETKRMGDFFRQCANAYRNKYLYTNDVTLKGSAYAFIQLAEKFDEHTPKRQMQEEARKDKMVGSKKGRAVKY